MRFHAIAKIGKDKFVKYHNISDRKKFESFLSNKFPGWIFINYYNSASREYIRPSIVNPCRRINGG